MRACQAAKGRLAASLLILKILFKVPPQIPGRKSVDGVGSDGVGHAKHAREDSPDVSPGFGFNLSLETGLNAPFLDPENSVGQPYFVQDLREPPVSLDGIEDRVHLEKGQARIALGQRLFQTGKDLILFPHSGIHRC